MSVKTLIRNEIHRYGIKVTVCCPCERKRHKTRAIINYSDKHGIGTKHYHHLYRRAPDRAAVGALSDQLVVFLPYNKIWDSDHTLWVIIDDTPYIVDSYAAVPLGDDGGVYVQAFISQIRGARDDYEPLDGGSDNG